MAENDNSVVRQNVSLANVRMNKRFLLAKFDCPVARQNVSFLAAAHDYETGICIYFFFAATLVNFVNESCLNFVCSLFAQNELF